MATKLAISLQSPGDRIVNEERLFSIIERQRDIIKGLREDLSKITAHHECLLNESRDWEQERHYLNSLLERAGVAFTTSLKTYHPPKNITQQSFINTIVHQNQKNEAEAAEPVFFSCPHTRPMAKETAPQPPFLSYSHEPIMSDRSHKMGDLTDQIISWQGDQKVKSTTTDSRGVDAVPLQNEAYVYDGRQPTTPVPGSASFSCTPSDPMPEIYSSLSTGVSIEKDTSLVTQYQYTSNDKSEHERKQRDGYRVQSRNSQSVSHSCPLKDSMDTKEFGSYLSLYPGDYNNCHRKDSLTGEYKTSEGSVRRRPSQPYLFGPIRYDKTIGSTWKTNSEESIHQDIAPFCNATVTLSVFVIGSNIITNEFGKKLASFTISVWQTDETTQERTELWKIEKLYSDFLTLDAQLRTRGRFRGGKMSKLPEKGLFTTYAPSKVDKRKTAIERYLQHAINLRLSESIELRTFINTNIINDELKVVPKPLGLKQGYLTKRGKNFGGWKTRYFILNGPRLQYYEGKGGVLLGTINVSDILTGCQPTSKHPIDSNESSLFRHSFMIFERKKSATNGVHRHILCAESDTDRDEWLAALSQCTHKDLTRNGEHGLFRTESLPLSSRKLENNLSSSKSVILTHSMNGRKGTSEEERDQDRDSVSDSQPSTPTYYPMRSNSDSSILLGESTQMNFSTLSIPALSETMNDTSPLPSHRSSMDQTHTPWKKIQNSQYLEQTSGRQNSTESFFAANAYSGQNKLINDQEDYDMDDKKAKKVNRRIFWAKKIFTNNSETQNKNSSSLNTTPSLLNGPVAFRAFLSRSSAETAQTTGNPSPVKYNGRRREDKTSSEKNICQVFGVPLDTAVRISRVSDSYELPCIIHRCIEYLEAKNATQEEGIYRLSGSAVKINILKKRFNEKGDINLLCLDEFHDIHAIAGLLKLWLRELPGHVLCQEYLADFILVLDLIERSDRINELRRLISMLPLANYTLLRTLTAHLIRIIQNSHTNKMTLRNIGIVFSPTLRIPASIFYLLLSEFDEIFWANKETILKKSIGYSPYCLQDSDIYESIHPTQTMPSVVDFPAKASPDTLQQLSTENWRRLHRISAHYKEGAPQSIIGLEACIDGPVAVEDEDEADDLCLRHEEDEYTDTEDEDDAYPTNVLH